MKECAMCADEGIERNAPTYRDGKPVCIRHALEWDEFNGADDELEAGMEGWNGTF